MPLHIKQRNQIRNRSNNVIVHPISLVIPVETLKFTHTRAQTKFDIYALIPELAMSHRLVLGVCNKPYRKFGGFRSRLEASRMSSHTEELMTIYIYIYIVWFAYFIVK